MKFLYLLEFTRILLETLCGPVLWLNHCSAEKNLLSRTAENRATLLQSIPRTSGTVTAAVGAGTFRNQDFLLEF